MISFNNGEYAFSDQITVSTDNLGFDRSFGVFDFMRMENEKILFIDDHLQRFDNSQKFLFEKAPYSKEDLKEIMYTLKDLNGVKESTFKLILTAEIKGHELLPHLIILNNKYKAYPDLRYQNGMSLLSQVYVREFAKIKTLNYLASFQSYEKMAKSDAIDILFHQDGQISEASRSNIFMVKKGKIYTSKLNILEGITRKVILRSFENELKVSIKDISYKELLAADEVFISSTLKKVMPIVRIGKYKIGHGKVGPITKKAMQRFSELSQ